MLDKTVIDRAEELIPVELDKLRQEAWGEVTRKSNDLAKEGLSEGGHAVAQVHAICVQQVAKRAEMVWRVLQRVLATLGIGYTDTLARDLKTFVDCYVPGSLWELPELYAQMGGQALYTQQFGVALLEARAQTLQRVHSEISFYVDGLRGPAQKAAGATVKERDQKFGILLSPKQAMLDFDEWKGRLRPGDGAIAVLFIDIDQFKALNTRYNETVVDQTILPDVLRLLAGLVDQRGGGYQQGGDEFVLILPNHDKAEAAAFAEKVRSRVASHQFRVGEQTETLTISGGVAIWPEHGDAYRDVLLKANQAKQHAKQARNVILLAD